MQEDDFQDGSFHLLRCLCPVASDVSNEWQQKYADAMGEKTAYKDLSLWKLVVNALTV